MMRMEDADEVRVLEMDRNWVVDEEGGRNCWVLGHCSRVQDHGHLDPDRDVRVQDEVQEVARVDDVVEVQEVVQEVARVDDVVEVQEVVQVGDVVEVFDDDDLDLVDNLARQTPEHRVEVSGTQVELRKVPQFRTIENVRHRVHPFLFRTVVKVVSSRSSSSRFRVHVIKARVSKLNKKKEKKWTMKRG